MGKGATPVLEKSSLHEVNDLYDAIADAGDSLAAERRSREAAEKDRNLLLERETALREEAQRQNTAKDQFLALLGHELRNPLAAITGATAVLCNPRTAPEAKEKFLALSVDCNGRHVLLDPHDGAAMAVAECARNVVCSGAEPLGLTDCLNFASPEKPQTMWCRPPSTAPSG